MKALSFSGRKETYFIAEIGSNFDGSFDRAIDLINLAKEAGADAAKFQHYTADALVSGFEFDRLSNSSHQSKWSKSVFETYRQAELNVEWTEALSKEATRIGIDFFTSAYSLELVDCVAPHVCAYKVGSGDITNWEILQAVGSKGKPVLLGTGASTAEEVSVAVELLRSEGAEVMVMQCNTNYTGASENQKFLNLRVLSEYQRFFSDCFVGLSDHTNSPLAIISAISLGALAIERHFTDDTARNGPDHPFSMDVAGWREMVSMAREVEEMLGEPIKKIEANEMDSVVVQRRGICASRDLSAGSVLTSSDLCFLRPCPDNALSPMQINEVVGRRLLADVCEGQLIFDSLITGEG